MAVDGVLLSEMVSGIPSCRVGVYPEEMKFQGRFVRIAASDVAVLITGDEEFTVPALVRDHACGRTCNAGLCLCVL